MTLPIAVSIPHAGLRIPEEVADICVLDADAVVADGDVGAMEAYAVLWERVQEVTTTNVARAIVDMNRAEGDLRKDGVVKTHTCWDVPIYREPLSPERVEQLMAHYHRPFHGRLRQASSRVRLGVDCHTMAATGPPVGPDPGVERPQVCISDGHGATFPEEWTRAMAVRFGESFPGAVGVNEPFTGGHIVRTHAKQIPWLQIELSRDPWCSSYEKGERVLRALTTFCELDLPPLARARNA